MCKKVFNSLKHGLYKTPEDVLFFPFKSFKFQGAPQTLNRFLFLLSGHKYAQWVLHMV